MRYEVCGVRSVCTYIRAYVAGVARKAASCRGSWQRRHSTVIVIEDRGLIFDRKRVHRLNCLSVHPSIHPSSHTSLTRSIAPLRYPPRVHSILSRRLDPLPTFPLSTQRIASLDRPLQPPSLYLDTSPAAPPRLCPSRHCRHYHSTA